MDTTAQDGQDEEDPRRLLHVTVYKPNIESNLPQTGDNDLFVVASILSNEGKGENVVFNFCDDPAEKPYKDYNFGTFIYFEYAFFLRGI